MSEDCQIKAPHMHPADAISIILLTSKVNKMLFKVHDVNSLHWCVADEDSGDVSRSQAVQQVEALASCVLVAWPQQCNSTGSLLDLQRPRSATLHMSAAA